MTRPIATGLWLRSEELDGWRIQYRGADPSVILETHDYEDETPQIISASWTLDGLGNLSKATLNNVEHPMRDPFSFAARLELYSNGSWFEIWEGMFKNVDPNSGTEGTGGLYVLEFGGLHEKVVKKYWHGFASTLPPAIPALGVNAHVNLSSIALPDIAVKLEYDPLTGKVSKSNLMVKVSDVISKALEPYPDASWGVDANRRAVLGRPRDGTAVNVPASSVFDLSATGYEIPPYITESRSDPGEGWQKFNWQRTAPEFTPEIAGDGPSPRIVQQTTSNALPYSILGVDLYALEDLIGPEGNPVQATDENGDPIESPPGTPIYEQQSKATDPPGRIVTKGYATYIVSDPQSWFKGSALLPENQSTYEPETAIFTLGLDLERLPVFHQEPYQPPAYYELVLDFQMWISTYGVRDPYAVGEPIVALQVEPSPLHVSQSPHTIEFFKGERVRLTSREVGLKRKFYRDLVIDPSFFIQKHPEFIALWGERYYVHMALSCFLEPPNTTQTPDAYSTQDLIDGLDEADVTFFHSVAFGQKIAENPDFNAEVAGTDYPFFVGPSFEGWVDGALCTPAYVNGLFLPSSASLNPTPVTVNQYVAGVDCTLEGLNLRSSLKTGILPYAVRNSRTLEKRRRT